MSKRVFFGQNDLRFLYFRYKDSNYYSISVIVLIIVVCVILVFMVIIPQAENYFSIRREVVALRSKISVLNENINFMNNIDKSVLNSQLNVTTQALPAEKDFAGINNALTASAIRSGVTIDDFVFNIGKESSAKSQSSVSLVIKVNGTIDRVKRFLKEISEKLPISEVSSIESSSNSTNVTLAFHYQSFPKIVFKEDEPITPLTDPKKALIQQLSSWQTGSNLPGFVPSGSSSAVPLFE